MEKVRKKFCKILMKAPINYYSFTKVFGKNYKCNKIIARNNSMVRSIPEEKKKRIRLIE